MTSDQFFQELQRILLLQPKRPSQILNSENCLFGNFIYYGKDLFQCFDCSKSTLCSYMTDCHNCSNSMDMDFTYETEKSFECVDCFQCFNSTYLENCANMTDSDFSVLCRGCHDVFGCVKLENKAFCIFNRQFTEAEYREKVKYLKTLPAARILAEVAKIKAQHPLTQTIGRENENSTYGNYMFKCRNCYLCFDSENCEDSGYIYDSGKNKRAYDISQSGEIELSYQVLDSGLVFNSSYIVFSKNIQDSRYLFDCLDVKNSMGCVGLMHKEYCFLNRQLTPEEYEKVTQSLIAELIEKDHNWRTLIY